MMLNMVERDFMKCTKRIFDVSQSPILLEKILIWTVPVTVVFRQSTTSLTSNPS